MGFTKVDHKMDYWRKWVPAEAFVVLDAIIRKTAGWHKEEAAIATSVLMEMTGQSKRKVEASISYLIGEGVIRKVSENGKTNIYKVFLDPSVPADKGSYELASNESADLFLRQVADSSLDQPDSSTVIRVPDSSMVSHIKDISKDILIKEITDTSIEEEPKPAVTKESPTLLEVATAPTEPIPAKEVEVIRVLPKSDLDEKMIQNKMKSFRVCNYSHDELRKKTVSSFRWEAEAARRLLDERKAPLLAESEI
jgi:phage replication O-like protein O